MNLTWDGMIGGLTFAASTQNILDIAAEVSAPPGGIREKEDGACAECRPSSPGQVSDVAPQQGVAGVSGCYRSEGDRTGSRPGDATGLEKPPHQVQILTADSKISDVADLATGPLVGNSGGEVVNSLSSSPLHKFQEVTPMRDESQKSGLRLANGCGEKRPVNTHVYETNLCESFAPEVRQGGVEGRPIEAPPLEFPADNRFADNICRALDAADKAERDRLEEIEAEREGLMTEMSGYSDPAEDARFV